MKNLLTVFILLFFALSSQAQFDINPKDILDKLFGPIESDRPGKALSASTSGIMTIQLQTGFNYEYKNVDKIYRHQYYQAPTNLRLGLTKKWELNSSFTFAKENSMDTVLNYAYSGFKSPEIGIRYAFLKGSGWKPFMALQSNLSFLSHKGDYYQQKYGSSFYLISSNQFDAVSINLNGGIRFKGDSNKKPEFPWVINLGFNMGDKWNAFIEGFGEFTTQRHAFDAGFAFRPIPDLQFDVSGGWLNGFSSSPHYFIDAGISYKFSFLKMIINKKTSEMMQNFKL